MEPTTLTFEQQLIHTLLQCYLQEQRLSDLTDSDVSRIRYFAKKLSEGTEPEVTSKLSPSTKLAELPLSTRLLNGLRYNGIETVADLTSHTKEELTRMRLIGYKSFREIVEFLYQNNLRLKQ